MDPNTVLTSLINAIQATSALCKEIQTINGLPEAFTAASKGLHVAEEIAFLLKKDYTDSMLQAHSVTLTSCLSGVRALGQISATIGSVGLLELNNPDWTVIVDSYRQLVLPYGQAGKVEILTLKLLNDLRTLMIDKGAKWVSQQQDLEDARELLAEVDPSLPDSEFEGMAGAFAKDKPSPSGGLFPVSGYSETPMADEIGSHLKDDVMTLEDEIESLSDTEINDQRKLLLVVRLSGEWSIRALLKRDRIDLECKDETGRTALSWAAGEGKVTAARLLLQQNVMVDSPDQAGRTPLSWAAGEGKDDAVRLLLQHRAIPDVPDHTGRTPLSWAAGEGKRMAIRILLQHKALIDFPDHTGRTPLSWAVGEGREISVAPLLQYRPNISYPDHTGRTPLLWAADKGYRGISLLLMQAQGIEVHGITSGKARWLSNTDMVNEGLVPADFQPPSGELDLDLHQPVCAHKVKQAEKRESGSQQTPDLRSQHLRRFDMQRRLSLLCGLAGLSPPGSRAPDGFWADFSLESVSIYYPRRQSNLIQKLNEAMGGLISGAVHLQQSGFCCNQFTVLTASHETDTQVARMNTISFDRLIAMQKSIAAIQNGNLSESAISQSASESIAILESIFDTQLCLSTTTDHELQLHYCSLAVQLLCLGLLLYSQAHVTDLHLMYVTKPLNKIILQGSLPGVGYEIFVEKCELACTKEMVGGTVFVFKIASQKDILAGMKTKIYGARLSATCEQIVDSWGPASLLFVDSKGPSEEKISGLVLRGGIIKPHGVSTHGYPLFHWGGGSAGTDAETFSYWDRILIGLFRWGGGSAGTTFSYRERILIGAVVDNVEVLAETSAGPSGGRRLSMILSNGFWQSTQSTQAVKQLTEKCGSVTINRKCQRKPEETWDASQWYCRMLGTGPSAWKFVERSWMLQFGDKVLGQVGAAETKQPGVPAKRTVLDRWTNEGKLSLLEELHGLQVSLCTGVAQRVSLRVLVRDNLMDYVRSLNIQKWDKIEKEAIEAMESKAKFAKWESELVPESRVCVEKVVDKILKRLKDTGFDKNGVELAVLWPNKAAAEFCLKIPPEGEQAWCRMLKNTEWSTTFAVATNSCLVAPSFKCRDDTPLWGGMNMLATFVYPSFARSVPSTGKHHEKGWQIRHHGLYWSGEIGGKAVFLARKVPEKVTELEFYPNRLGAIPRAFWSRALSSEVLVEAPRADFTSEEVFVVSKSKISSG